MTAQTTRERAWWETDAAALEAMWRVSAREADWKGCEAALLLMAAVDPRRADLLYQTLRVAAASGKLVMPTASQRALDIERHMVEAKAAALETAGGER